MQPGAPVQVAQVLNLSDPTTQLILQTDPAAQAARRLVQAADQTIEDIEETLTRWQGRRDERLDRLYQAVMEARAAMPPPEPPSPTMAPVPDLEDDSDDEVGPSRGVVRRLYPVAQSA